MSYLLLHGDARHIPLATESVQCVVTSPPYFGLRSYLQDGDPLKKNEIGLGELDAYIADMVAVFHEVRRVLKKDGVLWLNLGDSYNGSGGAGGDYGPGGLKEGQQRYPGRKVRGLKVKDLIGIPWRVAFALQDDGWWLRSEIIWHKSNGMTESAIDRPSRAHEHIFLLAKAAHYFYDADAIAEPAIGKSTGKAATFAPRKIQGQQPGNTKQKRAGREKKYNKAIRRRRTIWKTAVSRYPGAHTATFPPELVEPMILAGSRPGDIILDPFAGSGTVGVVAMKHHRNFVGIELNTEFIEQERRRLMDVQPTLFDVSKGVSF